jgi:hypothetical protein
MRRLTALAAILAVGAVPLAGCGGSKAPGIPKRDATELLRLLRKAQAESDNPQQRCDSLLATVRKLEQKVAALPSKVDRDVRDTLTNGVKNLAASSASLCQQTQTTPTTPTTPTVPTTPTTPPPTTQTTPPPTTQTTPPPTTQTTPPPTTPPPTTPGTGGTGPGAGNGNGNGIGNGKRGFRPGGNGHRGGGD